MVIDVVGLEKLSISEIHSAHVLVSLAQVVIIVPHVSPKETRFTFVREVLGFDVFTNAMFI